MCMQVTLQCSHDALCLGDVLGKLQAFFQLRARVCHGVIASCLSLFKAACQCVAARVAGFKLD